MVVEKDLEKFISDFTVLLSGEFKLAEVWLFGSYATGTAGEDSDIDLAIISNDFEGNRFYDCTKISNYVIDKTYPELQFAGIEVHPFRTEDFTIDDPFVEEIMKTGRRII